MSAASLRRAVLAVLLPAVVLPPVVLLTAAPVYGQVTGLRPLTKPLPPVRIDPRTLPSRITADRLEGVSEKETIAEGKAEINRGTTAIFADWLRFDNEAEEVEAKGSVRIERDGDVVTGPALRYRMNDGTGVFESPVFSIAPRPRRDLEPVSARGSAGKVEFQGEDHYRVLGGSFTTCKPGNEDWVLRAEQLDLDYGKNLGTAKWATLYFMDTPLIKTPTLEFSLNNERKSGFLSPIVGVTGKSGPEITVPYYLNLAPNYDLTVLPRYMEKRGLQIGGEFRYMDRTYNGVARAEVLPDDQQRGITRSVMALSHSYKDGPWSGGLNLNKASDNNYFKDLSSRLSIVSQTYLPREGVMTYQGQLPAGGSWGATGRFQSFQTLQDPTNPVLIQYSRAPQLLFNASRPDVKGFDFSLQGETVDFHHPEKVVGLRNRLQPSVSYPIISPGAFITPKIGVDTTLYSLSRTSVVPGTPDTIQRTLPVFSTDSGLTFERAASYFGQSFQQTLEPRAFYLYRPYRDQSNIPLFDTALADFNYAQIFSENSFSGGDRLVDANQLTLAVTSRLLSPASGQEAIRATIGQRYYMRDQRVPLDASSVPRTYQTSDWIASLAGRVAPKWTMETNVQYNSRESRTERLTVGTRYNPELLKTINMSYRYMRDTFNQADVSAQWPLGGGWHGVGRMNYSIKDSRIVESLGGLEYNGGCWIVRGVLQRFATGTGGGTTNAIFIQLELNGFSRIGANPLEALKRNIPGYTRLNQTVPPGRAFDFESNQGAF